LIRILCYTGVKVRREIAMRWVPVLIFLLGWGFQGAIAEEAPKGWLGAIVGDVTKDEAAKLGWEAPRGARVVRPTDGSPAAASLEPGDVILSVDKQEIDSKADFDAAIAARGPGASVRLRLLRGGKEKMVSLTLGSEARRTKLSAADAPQPMLDTGGHMALIRGVTFTPDGRQLVSASDDKTIRVWDLATGKTLRMFRGEAAPGPDGRVFAMALSPDGKLLAAAGWMKVAGEVGHHIRLYDFATGEIVGILQGHTDVVDGVAFSPDGRQLISGSADTTAIIWDIASRKIRHRLQGHHGSIFAVRFTRDGARAVTGSYDKDVKLWSVESGALIKTMQGHETNVQSVDVSRNGVIASGDWSGEIRLWDGRTGEFLRKLDLRTSSVGVSSVGTVSFSPDGKVLLSGIGYSSSDTNCYVHDVASGKIVVTYHGTYNNVIAAAISPDGRWAACGGNITNDIHIWDIATAKRRDTSDGKPLGLGGTGRPVWAASFSSDGRQISWGTTLKHGWTVNDYGPLEQILTLPAMGEVLPGPLPLPADSARNFRHLEVKHGAWSLSHRKGGRTTNVREAGALDVKEGETVRATIELGSSDGYQHRVYTFTPDGRVIVSGAANGSLTAYSLEGKKLGDFVGHESDIWSVVVSPDGKYLVSGSDDQTVRLWNLKTYELIVTLFQGSDGEWVMWTPQGYFAASGPGSDLIGWQINRGPANAAEYVTAAQLRKYLNRPDIITKSIVLASAEEAVRTSPGTDFKLADLLTKPVPRFRITSPLQNAALEGGKAQVEIALEPTPDPVKFIRIQVNGSQVAEQQPQKGGSFKPGKLSFEIPLSRGRNAIRVVAVNDTGETPMEVAVTHQGKGALDKLGVLYVLAIGVDKYPGLGKNCLALDGKTRKTCDLKSAGADAKAFAKAVIDRAGPLHERVVQRVLVNGGSAADAPTAANILDALGSLSQSKSNDTIMLFVAGHGINEAQSYRFLATDATYSDGALRNSTVVPWVIFQATIEAANGRRILFLDTCRSGNSYNQRLSNDSYAANIVVYSATRWDQDSLEREDLGHGLFTYAVVEGLNGAATNPAGEVKTESLRDFLRNRVRELAKSMKADQEPQYFRGRDAQDYLLAVTR
jgi:WD40 repeat protein/uncharacterized caspase-like protein